MLRYTVPRLLKNRDFRMRSRLKFNLAVNSPGQDLIQSQDALGHDNAAGDKTIRRARKASSQPIRLGADIAREVRTMTDAEWEATSLNDKHAFTKYIAKQLRDAPSTVSEQQRRRYYETTARDPRDEDPARTVMDLTERIRLGLPARVAPERRQLGVTDAVYQQADATLFDPGQAHRIEHAVTEVKQMFVDYVRKKKEGVSTEHERRALANASEELHFQTQRHLANMFKYAEARARDIILEERMKQLRHIAAVRRYLRRNDKKSGDKKTSLAKESSPSVEEAPPSTRETAQTPKRLRGVKPKAMSRADRVKRVLRDTYGLDVDTAKAVWDQMMAQEKFLRLCEVMARMTLGTGFTHTSADESLDEYTARLRDLYSSSPDRLCKIEAVQYLAATEGVPPVDWATRWYEKALLLPIQTTPEYKDVQRIKQEEEEVARAVQIVPNHGAAATAASAEGNALLPPPAPNGPAHRAEAKATSLVAKMFLSPDDPRIATQHEKRLRYIAHLHLESQVKRLRQNAHLFEGVEATEEAERCRTLYAAINERKAALLADETVGAEVKANPFVDETIRSAFEEIQSICAAVIKARLEQAQLDAQAKRAGSIASALNLGKPEAVEDAVRESKQRLKREQLTRLLRLVEKDVREDMVWVDNMAESERPQPLPIPEPMSYVSAGDVMHWKSLREVEANEAGNPFRKTAEEKAGLRATFLGQPWKIPSKPELFWGTGTKAVEQALKHATEDAERRRGALPGLPPPYPCAENPWGWRLRQDVLDEELPEREAASPR